MNLTLEVPTLARALVCAGCGQKISINEQIHLRDSCALPEEPTYHVHENCADNFIASHPGCWNQIAPDSIEAGWLLY